MTKQTFNCKEVPDEDNLNLNTLNENLEEIIKNYKNIKNNSYEIIQFCLNSNLIKPITLYNLLFYVEISLKYLLITKSPLSVSEIENKQHCIFNLINCAKEYIKNFRVEKLEKLLKKIDVSNRDNIDCNQYCHYKYNKLKGKENLIFDFELTEKDKNNIKEVVEWINEQI